MALYDASRRFSSYLGNTKALARHPHTPRYVRGRPAEVHVLCDWADFEQALEEETQLGIAISFTGYADDRARHTLCKPDKSPHLPSFERGDYGGILRLMLLSGQDIVGI
ncbi:hypothetical protein PUNSTDRAFT_135080 [Punctularia strigosozonata HHB-11173 SS5]|uniref:uncharacterized protein n=1 Tax=Punctularia strigosozonata (strain HHB-11173) TaxID=741275 RepID=UPI000441782B|nr:uncharacterized protein PUNSTDRAFT_135080 [Punctularia strigosozonata HHB-11173 SS5]EIN07554.1 hypothetical protein PUNSTDRAFT_135080 [Punctularia strigosozonata HHB-11173 SS5]